MGWGGLGVRCAEECVLLVGRSDSFLVLEWIVVRWDCERLGVL